MELAEFSKLHKDEPIKSKEKKKVSDYSLKLSFLPINLIAE